MGDNRIKRFALILIAFIFCLPAFSFAETVAEDYSWLDDMTINQLKALDAEIHKRISIPSDAEAADQPDDSVLIGEWVYQVLNEYNVASYVSYYGHFITRTLYFYPEGIGYKRTYDETSKKTIDAYSFTYEMKSEDYVSITYDDLLGSVALLFTLSENEGRLCLQRMDNGWLYSKID